MEYSEKKIFLEGVAGRLKLLRGGMDAAPFTKIIDITYNTYTAFERAEKAPSARNLAKIATGSGCNLNWLLTGEGEPYLKAEYVIEPEAFSGDAEEAATYYQDHKPIRVVGRASANPNETIDWEEVEHETTELGAAVAIRVHDDSMEPIAREGQYVLAIPDVDLRDGDLAVVRVRRKGVFFKRVFLRGKEEMELQSANPLRPQQSMIIKAKDVTKQFRVIGVKFE